jgi:hypothetical protein
MQAKPASAVDLMRRKAVADIYDANASISRL